MVIDDRWANVLMYTFCLLIRIKIRVHLVSITKNTFILFIYINTSSQFTVWYSFFTYIQVHILQFGVLYTYIH